MRRGRTSAFAGAVTLFAGGLVASGPPAAAAPVPPARAVSPTSGQSHVVTLVTGDTVRVTADGRVLVTAGPGRERTRFSVTKGGGRIRVVPRDTIPLLAADRLDPRLFDVTQLIEFGYDQRRGDLPLILTGARSGQAAIGAAHAVPGGTALRVAKGDLRAAWTGLSATLGTTPRSATGSATQKLWLDGLRRPVLRRSVPQIGAPAAWAAGLTGAGVTVAVLDTGIDATQADLVGQVTAAQDFTGSGDTRDSVGHGTHVASTIAGTGAAPGGYRGVASGARLVAAKVCTEYCFESAILDGIQWSVDQGARIVNLSLGGGDSPEEDLVEAAVNRLSAERDVLFVAAAGNDGVFGDHTVSSPASADAALAVGAVDKRDVLAASSARGPRVGDEALKPDITAPGVSITAARSADSPLGAPGEPHATLSGTSMAAPHVAGAAALLAQRYPTWTAADLKAALMASATPAGSVPVTAQGAGRVDVARGIGQTVLADPPSVSFGRQEYPYDQPATRTLTYRNRGASAVTLTLAAPAGFATSATSLTVPPGGQAGVTVTANVAAAGSDGFTGGYLVATAGGTRVTTPVGFHREPQHFDLTIGWLDTSGRPVSVHSAGIVNLSDGTVRNVPLLGQPTETVSLPRGTYAIYTTFYSADGVDLNMFEPEVVVDQDRAVTFDGRTPGSLSVSVPEPDAEVQSTGAETIVRTDVGSWHFSAYGIGPTVRIGQPDPAERSRRVTTAFTAQLFQPSDDPAAISPYAYHLAWKVEGFLPTGHSRRYAANELATVDARFATQADLNGLWSSWALFPDTVSGTSALVRVPLPGRRTEYYATGNGLRWANQLLETTPGNFPLSSQFSARVEYQAGRRYTETRNRAVSGPGFDLATRGPEAFRTGDTLVFNSQPHGSAGWAGWRTTQERTVITRDGTVLTDVPTTVAVVTGQPPREATYTVRVESADTDGTWALSTSVTCEWTFRSAAPPTDRTTVLPLSAVRFTPAVDDTNTAPAGRPFLLPVQVQRQPDSAAAPVRSLTVDVSYDDGKTWRSAPVVRVGDQWRAALRHPAAPGFVSVRGRAVDATGNTNTVTVLRAYRIA
jgi:subtilisin family serine protease